VVARTLAGRVRGRVEAGVNVFKGIPYGGDTSGFRFMAPVGPVAWEGVRDCFVWGDRAPQLSAEKARAAAVSGERPWSERVPVPVPWQAVKGPQAVESGAARVGYHLPADEGAQSEDCLHVNVWTRGLRDGRKRPVLFYIHGGAYNSGTVNSALYDGRRLCERGDVVVVTVNHRLNAFGHMYLAELGGEEFKDSGNVGILDLVLALEWVRENVAEFGGDPGRVLIFGQSGGGAKCATLMAMPRAKGLFHRVVTMSGQQVTAKPTEVATAVAKEVLAKLGVGYGRAADLETLKTMPWEKIQEAARVTTAWLPVRDGGVLARDPFDPDAPGISAGVAMMLGNTHDETVTGPGNSLAGLTGDAAWAQAPVALQASVGQYLGAYTAEDVVRRYREIYPELAPGRLVVAAAVAFRAWPGQVIEADRRGVGVERNTWVYRMDWKAPFAGDWSPHTVDIPFMFDNCELAPGMVGSSKDDLARARGLAAQMSSMLIRFAETGDPNGVGLPRWGAYRVPERETMIFDEVSRVERDPRGAERVFAGAAHYRQPGT
jgi:para-nitrobenzyl esterase